MTDILIDGAPAQQFSGSWLDTIIDFQFPSKGFFILSFQGLWEATTSDSDKLPVSLNDKGAISMMVAQKGKTPGITVLPPYNQSTVSTLTTHGVNAIQETILGYLSKSAPSPKFVAVFNGTSNEDMMVQAQNLFWLDAVNAGFFSNIAEAQASMVITGWPASSGPDPSLITVPTTVTITSIKQTINTLLMVNLSQVDTKLNPGVLTYPVALSIAPAASLANGGSYKWTVDGRTFKSMPPLTVSAQNIPSPSWWNKKKDGANAVSPPAGISAIITWHIDLNTLAVTIS